MNLSTILRLFSRASKFFGLAFTLLVAFMLGASRNITTKSGGYDG